MITKSPELAHLVLLGGGHAQIAVLKALGMKPVEGLRISLVSRDQLTPYSGMLPGHIEGYYSAEEASIDLVKLAAFTGARFIHDQAIGLDAGKRQIIFAERPPLGYDRLAVNTGSTPPLDAINGARKYAIPIKPVDAFMARLEQFIAASPRHGRIAIIGGGVAGIETALALNQRLNGQQDQPSHQITLIHQEDRLAPELAARASRLLTRALIKRGITLNLNTIAERITANAVITGQGEINSDLIILATGSSPPPWLKDSGLALNERGFIAIDHRLASISHPDVFAAGDIASLQRGERPKSGVFAVRAGPILAHNIRCSLTGRPLRPWRPQHQTLALVGVGGGKAITARGRLSIGEMRLAWRLKEWIDRRFIRRFSDLPLMPSPARPQVYHAFADPSDAAFKAMPCLGCGSKAGWNTLADALEQAYCLADRLRPELGIMATRRSISEDAALLPCSDGGEHELVESIDAISALVSDPFQLGRIATLHALSDLFASHAEPCSAQIMLMLARAKRGIQRDDMIHILTSVLITLGEHKASLIGGHTVSGDETLVGLSVTGRRLREPAERVPQYGDALLLTKPVGIGLIMAALHGGHSGSCSGASGILAERAIEVMLTSNAAAARALSSFGRFAMTDVTGFGLVRHCRSLLDRSGQPLSATLSWSLVPRIAGVDGLAAEGVASSIVDENMASVSVSDETSAGVSAALLHDPQTSGGLLVSVPSERVEEIVEAVSASSGSVWLIGHISDRSGGLIRIRD